MSHSETSGARDLREHLQTTLGTAYSVTRELGGGGMSRVFVAEDITLGRQVVVKVLPPDMASGVSIERFKREISLAARLQHPHIVALLSAGETAGLPYFTMPFIEGETLRARLTRSGELPIKEAVHLLREVASALAYAHRKGIVHRDIKPENVLVTEQHAMVMDFGVAKAVSAATEGGAAGLTSVGIALGTPAYMAPEQAAGDPGTDHRADIYAFGVIAYELLTGHTPFAGRTVQALMAAHIVEVPEPIAKHRVAVPPALAALVMRCLEKRPADRPQHAEDILRELDDVPVPRIGEKDARPSVAVLPMVNTSGDPENEHFSDGLTDELIGALSQVGELTVSGRTSVFALKGKGLSVRSIADTLRVAHVLEGSVRRAGNRLKVRVQLVDADGSVLWSEAFDRQLEDVFAVQEEIAQAVVRSLKIHLGTSSPFVRRATTDPSTHDLFLKGRYYRRRFTPGDLRRAIEYFEQAIARDPMYAPAYAWLASAHSLLIVFGSRPTSEASSRARAYAARAVALDPLLADGHWTLGETFIHQDYDWAGADRECQRALELEPGNVDARHLYAISLAVRGRHAEAEAECVRTLATDPLLAEASMTLGILHLKTGQLDRATQYLREAVELSPMFSVAREQLAHVYVQQGKYDDAVAEFELAAATGGASDRAQLAYGYAVSDRRAEATAILSALLAPGTTVYTPPFSVAMAYVGLGDADEAFRWLERAYADRDPWLIWLKLPTFEPLRADPRFAALLRKMGIEP